MCKRKCIHSRKGKFNVFFRHSVAFRDNIHIISAVVLNALLNNKVAIILKYKRCFSILTSIKITLQFLTLYRLGFTAVRIDKTKEIFIYDRFIDC